MNEVGERVWREEWVWVFVSSHFTVEKREYVLHRGLREAGFELFSPVGGFIYELGVLVGGEPRYIRVCGLESDGGLEIGIYNKWDLLVRGELSGGEWGLLWERIRGLWVSSFV